MAESIAIVPRRKRGTPHPNRSADRAGNLGGGLQSLLLASALFGLAVMVHAQTLGFPFLMSWDDPTYIVHNPWIRGLTLENLRFAFTKPYFSNYLPLHLVSYMLDFQFWGLNPFGFRLQSLVLAGLNAALAFVLTRRLFGSAALGAFAALLYAVHPSHVEAVAWLSIRKDLLSTFFLFLAVILYDDGTRERFRGASYAGSVVMFLLGLLSKVSIAMLPLFLLVLDLTRRWQGGAFSWKRSIATKIPYGVLAFALVILNDMAQVKTHLPYASQPLTYLMVKGQSVGMYLGLLTAILDGRPIYDAPWVGGFHGALYLSMLAFPPAVFAFAYARRMRVLTLGVAWIFVLLLPAIAFPLVTYMADRYLYAPSLGFCWILASGILWLAHRIRSEGRRALAAVAMIAVVFTFFVVRTVRYGRCGAPQKLWARASAKLTTCAPRAIWRRRCGNRHYGEAEQLYRTILGTNTVEAWTRNRVRLTSTRALPRRGQAMDRAVPRDGRTAAQPAGGRSPICAARSRWSPTGTPRSTTGRKRSASDPSMSGRSPGSARRTLPHRLQQPLGCGLPVLEIGAPQSARSATRRRDARRTPRPICGFRGVCFRIVLASVAVFGVAFLVHQPSLRFGFLTSWDDPTYDHEQSLDSRAHGREHASRSPPPTSQTISPPSRLVHGGLLALGMDPFGFHLQSVILAAQRGAGALRRSPALPGLRPRRGRGTPRCPPVARRGGGVGLDPGRSPLDRLSTPHPDPVRRGDAEDAGSGSGGTAPRS
jgi:hypothetical protein